MVSQDCIFNKIIMTNQRSEGSKKQVKVRVRLRVRTLTLTLVA